MVIELYKGQGIELGKQAPSMTHATIGLGWQERQTDGATFDLDASVVLTDSQGRAKRDEDFVFYNNLVHPSGSVKHSGDDRHGGSGDSDDEQIEVWMDRIPSEVDAIHILVSIDRAEQRRQNFGMVTDSYVRVFDADRPGDRDSQFRFNLYEDSGSATVVRFGVLERSTSGWRFQADTCTYQDLPSALQSFGLLAG